MIASGHTDLEVIRCRFRVREFLVHARRLSEAISLGCEDRLGSIQAELEAFAAAHRPEHVGCEGCGRKGGRGE
jgi:hypothetical protein